MRCLAGRRTERCSPSSAVAEWSSRGRTDHDSDSRRRASGHRTAAISRSGVQESSMSPARTARVPVRSAKASRLPGRPTASCSSSQTGHSRSSIETAPVCGRSRRHHLRAAPARPLAPRSGLVAGWKVDRIHRGHEHRRDSRLHDPPCRQTRRHGRPGDCPELVRRNRAKLVAGRPLAALQQRFREQPLDLRRTRRHELHDPPTRYRRRRRSLGTDQQSCRLTSQRTHATSTSRVRKVEPRVSATHRSRRGHRTGERLHSSAARVSSSHDRTARMRA